MSSIQKNKHIARLIVGAMSIDGVLNANEQEKVGRTLESMGMPELIADVGAAIEDDMGDFDLFQETKELLDSFGEDSNNIACMVFRLVASVVASDRFVSLDEATYLSALSRRLKIETVDAQQILKSVMAERRGRLEVAASGVDALIHKNLKELLSFSGAEDMVGALSEDSLEELLHHAQEAMAEGCEYSTSDVKRALAVLGLDGAASLEDAKEVWMETIEELDLPKMAGLGETFVTAAINRITEINQAYRTVVRFHDHLENTKKASSEAQRLARQIERDKEPSTRNNLTEDLEESMTGVGTGDIAGQDER